MDSVPVVTVGVVMAVSTPVVGLIAYIDTVLLPELVTYAKVPAEFTAIAPGKDPVATVGVDKAVSTPVVAFIPYIDTVWHSPNFVDTLHNAI